MLRENTENGSNQRIRVAIYVRVSTVYQIDKDSLPMMKQDLTAYCKYILNTEDYVIFEDAGYSGKNMDRPAYQKMMSQVRQGLFTHILVWKIDRISRNLLDFANMYAELKELGVTFVSKNEQFDTSTAIGEAMLKIILVFAELERNMTSERVTATMINRANNGIWNGGRVPFGYAYDKESQTFSFDEAEQKIVRLIFDTYEKTGSIVHTSRKLNDSGFLTRSGNVWSATAVWIILRNPWYKGVYRYNYYKIPGRKAVKDKKEWVIVENHHKPSIDPERFDKIQLTLTNNARYRRSPGRSNVQKNVHIFAGLLWCGECGAAFTSSPGKLHASGYRPSKYGCPNVRKTKTCHAKYTSDVVVGEFVINYILNIINAHKDIKLVRSPEDLQQHLLRGSTFSDICSIDSGGLSDMYDMLTSCSKSGMLFKRVKPKIKVDPELKQLQSEQKKQQRALDRLNELYLYSDESMSEREYIVRKQQITDKLDEINDAIGMMSQEPWMHTMGDSEFIQQASSFILNQKLHDRQYVYFTSLAESVDAEILKAFFGSIIDSIVITSGKIQRVTFRNGISHTFTYKNKPED